MCVMNTFRETHAGDVSVESHLEEAANAFWLVRPRLFGIAYRIVGNWTEAEDVVQDVWLRWQACDRSVVLNSTAFLVTTTTRLALNTAMSARARRESSVGRWTLDAADGDTDPARDVERGEAVELGLMLLLERLSATERAAYILREAFDYPYSRIAMLLQITEVNARKVVSRSGSRIAEQRRQPVSSAKQQQLVRAFAAARRGDCALLEGHLVSEAVSVSGSSSRR